MLCHAVPCHSLCGRTNAGSLWLGRLIVSDRPGYFGLPPSPLQPYRSCLNDYQASKMQKNMPRCHAELMGECLHAWTSPDCHGCAPSQASELIPGWPQVPRGRRRVLHLGLTIGVERWDGERARGQGTARSKDQVKSSAPCCHYGEHLPGSGSTVSLGRGERSTLGSL